MLLCTTKYYSSSTPYYKVLSSATLYYTPVLLRTTKCYSSTTPYYTVLLQYYSVLQSAAPVLLRTIKYYSSTTLYYKVLLQCYSVLQSTRPVLLVLQTITPVLLRSNSSSDSSSSSRTEDEKEATWKRQWVLMYTTQLNDTPKSLKRRKLKKPWETSNVGWH